MRLRAPCGPRSGHTLLELLAVIGVVGILTALAGAPVSRLAGRHSLQRSAALARAHLGRARLLAVARRETVRIRLGPEHELRILDSRGGVLAVTPLQGGGLLELDSVRLRPATLRYNPRGQAGPGSLYLYRGRRGVRLVSNFVGRVRREDFAF